MTGPEARAQIAAAVTAAVPPEWTVYAGLPDVVSFPGVVIQTPSQRLGTFCAEIHRMTVIVLEARSMGAVAYDSVDVMASTVLAALATVDGLAYESKDLGPMVAPGGVEAYGATLNIELYLN
jgi:hypothetical protein